MDIIIIADGGQMLTGDQPCEYGCYSSLGAAMVFPLGKEKFFLFPACRT